ESDDLDLDWCYYLGVTILNMSEEEFMKCTPKKLFKLAEIHQKLNSQEESDSKSKGGTSEEVYIDDFIF
ncbi:MAG: hypothetical protein RSH78_00185, partial [Bacilli bacterium]